MKTAVYVGAGIGGFIGGLIPVLFGDTSFMSSWSILTSLIGGLVGIYLGYKVAKYAEG